MIPVIVDDEGEPSLPATNSAHHCGDSPAEFGLSPNLFDRYELGKLIGCGAFAKVYQARDLRTGQSVAIKAVSKQRVQKGNLMAQVKREISIMHRLRHPNIIRLHEVLATKNKVYFVMEFATEGELFAKVAKGRFSEDLSRRYFQQLISAVSYCHSHGVYHRDLKPENLLLDQNWDLKVTDFGLSALTSQIGSDGLLHTLCGTPAYVAPEILEKKGYDGAKVDIWSCGIILYVLSAGYLPFNDTNLMAMYRKIYKGEFRCPKWTSPELKSFLGRLLDTNPETRITIDEIMEDPWFKMGGFKLRKWSQLEHEYELSKGGDHRKGFLNAFDIISFSTSVDLTGLFPHAMGTIEVERFVSGESPERIIDTLEEVGNEERVKVTRNKDMGLRMEGQNGNFECVVDIHRLTEKLVVVDIKRSETVDERSHDLWQHKFRPRLNVLIYDQNGQVSG